MSTPFLPMSAVRRGGRPLLASLAVLACAAAHAQTAPQGQSMEERLRAQLRVTTTQLQQAQNELAVIKAGGAPAKAAGAAAAASPSELDELKKELARSQAQLAAERQARDRASQTSAEYQQQGKALAEKAGTQVAQYRGAYDELLKMARASEAERQRLAGETATQRAAVTQCEAKNVQLYAVGQEVLHAYETLDIGTVMAARQPFAAQSRVKFEQIAQQYGDKLYEGRFDARSVTAPASAAAPAAAAPSTPAAASK